MEQYNLSPLRRIQKRLSESKSSILSAWVAEERCATILSRHEIDKDLFVTYYAANVFDYFMGVVSGQTAIGECPVMAELIEYLDNKEIRADELFVLCSHFKRSVINATYLLGINDQDVFVSISYLFDQNFTGVLKLYTDTIYQKEQEALEAGRAKEYFLSNMSHEIRTPLNAILGFVALLKDESTSSRHQNYLNIISNSGESLLHIINDILDFSKLRSGEFTVDPHPFNIHDELSHTMELFVPAANSKGITLISFIDPAIPYQLIADPQRIKQIVGNFLSNAVKFSHPDGAIYVEARYQEGILSLSVRDEGIGIAPNNQMRIFDAFSQAQEGNSRVNGGTGLGLSICKQLAEHMGGSIDLKSAPGIGSLFTLSIPAEADLGCSSVKFDASMFNDLSIALLAFDPEESYKLESLKRYWDYFGLNIRQVQSVREPCDLLIFLESSIDDAGREWIIRHQIPSVAIMDFLDDRYDLISNIVPLTFPIYCTKFQRALSDVLGCHETGERGKSSRNTVHGFQGTILVAEDNEANQELIRITLERYGLSCTIVPNGLEALEQYKESRFDLVLMDEQMPIMNGNDATAVIRAYEEEQGTARVPIIALSANVMQESRERAIQKGYNAFIGKPIVLKELEYIFGHYLEPAELPEKTPVEAESPYPNIDFEHLQQALMLDADQIRQLLEIYRTKMESSFQKLKSAIEGKDYKSVAFVAHSIKGSSANFRFEELSTLASVIEGAALKKNGTFDFEEGYAAIRSEYDKKFA